MNVPDKGEGIRLRRVCSKVVSEDSSTANINNPKPTGNQFHSFMSSLWDE